MKDYTTLLIAMAALLISFYQFAIKNVATYGIATKQDYDVSSGLHTFTVAYQNRGNVDVLMTNLDITAYKTSPGISEDCVSGELLVSQSYPVSLNIKRGAFTTLEYQLQDRAVKESRRHYCARFKLLDVYGKVYKPKMLLGVVSFLDNQPVDDTPEKMTSLAKQYYFFRP